MGDLECKRLTLCRLAPALLAVKYVLWHLPTLSRRFHEEAEGFLSYRVADRRGDHSDYRGHRDSELDACQDVGQRVLGRWFSPHDQHRGSELCDHVSDRRLYGDRQLGRRAALHAGRGDWLFH